MDEPLSAFHTALIAALVRQRETALSACAQHEAANEVLLAQIEALKRQLAAATATTDTG